MSVTYKDIDQLSQKSSVVGTEKLPVSDTEFITPAQITNKVATAAWFDPSITTMYWFASPANKSAFQADNTRTDLVLFSETIKFIANRILVLDSAGETSKSTIEDQTTLNITVNLTVQERSVMESSWRNISISPIDVVVYVDSGNTGNYTQYTTQHLNSVSTYTVDVRQPLVLGANKVKIHCSLTSDPTAIGELEYTVTMASEPYMVFVDQNVASICANNWGDGIGITRTQAASVTETQFGSTFNGNTSISSFDELVYFTGLSDRVPGYAFQNSSLRYVTFNTTTVGGSAFRTCPNLKRVDIGSNCTLIGNAAFYNSGSTSDKCTYIIRASAPPTLENVNAFTIGRVEKIYVPDSSVATYKATSKWSSFASVIDAISNYTG